METIELLKIDHKYSKTRVKLLVEAPMMNIEKPGVNWLKILSKADR